MRPARWRVLFVVYQEVNTLPPEAENNGTPTPRAGDGNQPQAGNPTTPQAGDAETISLEEARKLRSENAAMRARAKTAEDERDTLKAQGLTDLEKAQKKATDKEAEAATATAKQRSQATRYEVLIAANRMGIVDPDAAYKLLDTSKLEIDDDGIPTNVDKLLQEMTKARTWLLGAASGSSSAGRPATKGGGVTREQLRGMTANQVAALDPEVVRVALAS